MTPPRNPNGMLTIRGRVDLYRVVPSVTPSLLDLIVSRTAGSVAEITAGITGHGAVSVRGSLVRLDFGSAPVV